MGYNSTQDYLNLLDDLAADDVVNVPDHTIESFMAFIKPIYRSDLQNKYSQPMLWIGMYMAFASLLCILAMVADLLHGLRNRKLWFPSKYLRINATSLAVISVAMKLLVDLSGAMPGDVDQAAKLGSMAFMCTMMAHLLPSLAAMDTNQLLTNITALGVVVITSVVNVCIQINTGVVSIKESAQLAQQVANHVDLKSLGVTNKHRNRIMATVYVTILLLLLILYICSSLAILKSKQIIESKYQQRHKKASEDVQQHGHETAFEDVQQSPAGELLSVEKLQKHVLHYWIMAGSGNPQFIVACSVTTAASGVLCAVPTILHTLTMSWTIQAMLEKEYDSDYQWSMPLILIVQFIGVIVGTIAPFSRCFATLSFKVSIKSISNHIKVFKVESYWSSKLSEWKQGSMRFPFHRHKLKAVIRYSRNLILNICIEFQETVVVVCKMVALIPFFVMICAWSCFRCLKWLLKTIFRSLGKRTETSKQNIDDLAQYVLQLEDEIELAERTLEGLSKSMNRLIQKGEKKQPNNLNSLILEKASKGFQGVLKFDYLNHVPSLCFKENQGCWSLPVVTLTTIAVSLPNVEKDQVDSLLKSVREGLEYVTLVEESLNAANDYVSIRKAAETLWQEVDEGHKWLGNYLQDHYDSDQMDKTREIVEWYKGTAKKAVTPGVGGTDTGDANDDSTHASICANSMYRVTKTILLSCQANIDEKQLFDKLSTMIADIMAACLTNLPQVIAMKCHTSEIEKREASVQAAAKLLGETKQVIKTVQDHQPLDMKTNDLPFIGKWRAYLSGLENP